MAGLVELSSWCDVYVSNDGVGLRHKSAAYPAKTGSCRSEIVLE